MIRKHIILIKMNYLYIFLVIVLNGLSIIFIYTQNELK